MNHCIPTWNFEGDPPVTNQKKSMGPDHELVELLWQNGQVVLNSQTQRKLNDQPTNVSFENSSHLIQDDETVSWIHNSFEDCFEDELRSSLFNDLPSLDHAHSAKVPVPNYAVTPLEQQPNPVPPPRFQLPGSSRRSNSLVGFENITNLAKVLVPTKGDLGVSGGSGTLTQGKVREGSAMAVKSSHCGSNQVQNDPDFSTDHKRKRTDAEESPSQSEAAELESAGGCKSQSGSAKRSRAAQVHNLSERKRRDRINEKMKALQELIPHCSKTDKASMLDEAIEYLKSLQLQLQVMWMGGGMGPSPMMFPGVQQYMSRMSMGMGSPLTDQSMSVAQMPNQPVMCQNQAMSHVNYPNQIQNQSLPEQYARYMGFLQMQNTTQAMNMNMFKLGSLAMQQSQPIAAPVSNIGPFSCGATTNDALRGKNKLTSG